MYLGGVNLEPVGQLRDRLIAFQSCQGNLRLEACAMFLATGFHVLLLIYSK